MIQELFRLSGEAAIAKTFVVIEGTTPQSRVENGLGKRIFNAI